MSSSSSVVFSLKELSRMEDERVRAQAKTSERERAARELAVRESEMRARAEREARGRLEEQARREVERQAREEAARIEAMHRAAVAAACADAEARVLAEERERARRHELEVEHVRTRARGRATGTFVATAFGAVVAAGVAMAMHFGLVAPREQARVLRTNAEIASRDVTIADLRIRAEATDTRMHALEDDLATSRGENDRLRVELDAAKRAPTVRGGSSRGPIRSSQASPPQLDGFTSCPPGSKDPLCLH